MRKKNVLTLLLVMTSLAGWSQQVKIEFVTPRIVHVVKGQPTKTLVVTAKKEDVKVTKKGNEQSSGELTVRQDPKTGSLTFLTSKGQVLLREKSHDLTKVRQTFTLDKDEAIYGLGTIQNGKMNRRGEHKRMEQSNLEDFQNVLQSIKGWDSIGRTIRPRSLMMTPAECRSPRKWERVSTIISCTAVRPTA
jgi:alpha-D-xyloside xylohydrolase